jgi:hypothetical protein
MCSQLQARPAKPHPHDKTNRECILVSGRFDAHVVAKSAGGVSANHANALREKHPPTEGPLSINPGTKSAGQVRTADW